MLNLLETVAANRKGNNVGTYAVCSAHPYVIDAAVQQSRADGSLLHIESTASQVNQFGGYSGSTPSQFAAQIHEIARNAGLAPGQVLLGGDHIGPFPWRNESSGVALAKASQLVRDCVLAGYSKIHLDTSMPCADDGRPALDDRTVAERAAVLCQISEEAAKERQRSPLQGSSPHGAAPVYVIGTEVPVPGGESAHGEPPKVTSVENAHATVQAFQNAFIARGLSSAWERVIALVVQPGVEFHDHLVFDYDPRKAQALSSALPPGNIVYEAHSTDYQRPAALAELVRDHFAILKVGPWLTYAFREAVFALGAIERELLAGKKSFHLSDVRGELDRAMLQDPSQWRSYYSGDEQELALARAYSYSDRSRYYWHYANVQAELAKLVQNLIAVELPPGLLSQYLPQEYEAVRGGELKAGPKALIQFHIQKVLAPYAAACGVYVRKSTGPAKPKVD